LSGFESALCDAGSHQLFGDLVAKAQVFWRGPLRVRHPLTIERIRPLCEERVHSQQRLRESEDDRSEVAGEP
jgi:hypothetical protein